MEERKIATIPMRDIQSTPDRDMGDIRGLAVSMEKDGRPYLIEPIVVRTTSETGKYKVLAGRRRYAAAELLGWPNIEAVIMDIPDGVTDMDVALDENVQRLQMSPVEISHLVMADLHEVGITVEAAKMVFLAEDLTLRLCIKFNMDEDALIKHINLSLVDSTLRAFVHAGKLKLEAAIMTIGMDAKEIKRLAQFCAKSQRVVSSEMVWEMMESGDLEPLLQSGLYPDCEECQFRGGKDPVLFEMQAKDGDGDSHGRDIQCFNKPCLGAKMKELTTKVSALAKENGFKEFVRVHACPMSHYSAVEWPLAAKDQAKCKGCDHPMLFIQNGKFKIGCTESNCPHKNFNSKAEKMQREGKKAGVAVGGQEEKKPGRPVAEKLEMKVMLGLRRALMADAESYINKLAADSTFAFPSRADTMVARVGLYFGWDRDLIGFARSNGNGKDMSVDKALADWDEAPEDILHELGMVILKKQTAELIGRIGSRVDKPTVTWQELDYQALLLMNQKDYCNGAIGPIVESWKDKAKVEWNTQSQKGKNGWKLDFMNSPLLVLCEGTTVKGKPAKEDKPAKVAKPGKKPSKKVKKTPKPTPEPEEEDETGEGEDE